MTQHDLAQAAGMPQPSIARIEAGTVSPRTSTLIELLAATGHELALEPVGPAVDREAIRRRLAMSVPRRSYEAIGSPAKDRATSPLRILRRLRRFGVPFVLIGDLAEAAHGAPVRVTVIEVCHASTDVARERLTTALEDLGPQAAPSHLHPTTHTASGDDYALLERTAVSMNVDSGIRVRTAALDDLVRDRRARGTPEDDQAAAVLKALDTMQGMQR